MTCASRSSPRSPLQAAACECESCRAARAARNGRPDAATAHRAEGTALPAAVRASMESRFGRDFGNVRIHDDDASHARAAEHSARAFTVGQHIHFGTAEFQPHQPAGRRLLAHELAHAVQQEQAASSDAPAQAPRVDASGSPREAEADRVADAVLAGQRPVVSERASTALVQRQDKPAAASKVDVSLVFSGDDISTATGGTYAGASGSMLRVFNPEDACTKLKALGRPIGTIYVVSHANESGELRMDGASGGMSWVTMKALGAALKNCASPDTVDFRGCQLGVAEAELESFRSAVGAQSAKATNCWTFTQRATPLTIDGVPLTKPDQIPKDKQALYDRQLLQQIAALKADNGVPVKDCIIGLAAGEAAAAANLPRLWKLYWANQGQLVASWASPDYNRDWQKGKSLCTKSLTATTSPCKVIEKKAQAPATGGGGGGKPQGSLPESDDADTRSADAGEAMHDEEQPS